MHIMVCGYMKPHVNEWVGIVQQQVFILECNGEQTSADECFAKEMYTNAPAFLQIWKKDCTSARHISFFSGIAFSKLLHTLEAINCFLVALNLCLSHCIANEHARDALHKGLTALDHCCMPAGLGVGCHWQGSLHDSFVSAFFAHLLCLERVNSFQSEHLDALNDAGTFAWFSIGCVKKNWLNMTNICCFVVKAELP